ncbi:hypothetical protein IFM89_000995 [Coptis chinensis]|uniref:Exonuclease domain-containing protein n=1 Tax=Coptis chinensis TaxID=261450 RepID=A0A835II71_9MAGN|nr:hypothetical protein IFM89_000995 [Coptis chinensis]
MTFRKFQAKEDEGGVGCQSRPWNPQVWSPGCSPAPQSPCTGPQLHEVWPSRTTPPPPLKLMPSASKASLSWGLTPDLDLWKSLPVEVKERPTYIREEKKKAFHFVPILDILTPDIIHHEKFLPFQQFSRGIGSQACYKLYNKKEHLVEHMKDSYHLVHQPKCGGCLLGPAIIPFMESKVEASNLGEASQVPKAIAIDCEMVGGGSDGTLDLCAIVFLIDEDENVIFHAYVQPIIPVTNYRYEITGLTEEHLRDAMLLEEVQVRILEILQNGESISRMRFEGGKVRVLVGRNLEYDHQCLRICYPDHLLRDTAKYRPLMKTNVASHSPKYLTKTYLG